jgi:hypothetical protein
MAGRHASQVGLIANQGTLVVKEGLPRVPRRVLAYHTL